MRFFRVKNFEKYQRFKRERPPWIRFYVSCLRDPDIATLSLKSRAVYYSLLLLAAELKNLIPYEPGYLQQSLLTTESLTAHLADLETRGFILCDEPRVSVLSASASASASESELEIQCSSQLSNGGTTRQTKRKIAFPVGWTVEPWMERLCQGLGLNPVAEFTQFKNYHLAKGTAFQSWPHAFRTWAANAVKFKEGRK